MPTEDVYTFRIQLNQNLQATTRAPYSLQTTAHTTRTLPNNAAAALQPIDSTTAIYRDSMGRTRTERPQGAQVSGPNGARQTVLPQIDDPVAGYRYILDPVHQVAHRAVVPTRRLNPASATPVSVPVMPSSTQTTADGTTITNEGLGTQTISGVMAMGTRITIRQALPAGAQAGSAPSPIVTETWTSIQDGATLRSTNTSQFSTSSTEVKAFSHTEPDMAMFQVPADYKIVDEMSDFSITIPRPAP